MAGCLNDTVGAAYSNVTATYPHGGNGDNTTRAEEDYSKALADQVNHYIMKRGIPIISALGLLGNFLSLLVLTKEKLHKSLTKMEISAHIWLIALAVSDLLLCLMVLLATTLPFRDLYPPGHLLLYFHRASGGLITVFIVTSTWLIVVMAAERYVAVCHPLRARNLISLCRTRAYVVTLFVLCPLFTVPVFLESYVQAVQCADGRTMLRVDRVYKENVVVRRIVWALCFDFVPCAALVYFNTCLIWKIHKAKQLRKRLAPGQCGSGSVGGASGGASPCVPSISNHVRKFRWDGGNHSHAGRAGGRRGEGRGSGSGGSSSPTPSKCLIIAFSRRGRDKGARHNAHGQDLLDSSGSPDHSLSGAAGAGIGGSAGGSGGGGGLGGEKAAMTAAAAGSALRREMQLLCKQGSNGALKTSSRLSPTATPCRNGQSRQHRALMSRRRFSDNALNSVTATLVAVVLTFLVLVSPWELLKFGLEISSSSVDKYKVDVALYVTNLMQVLNFSFNFVLYCVVNKSFRHTLRKLACLQPIGGDVR